MRKKGQIPQKFWTDEAEAKRRSRAKRTGGGVDQISEPILYYPDGDLTKPGQVYRDGELANPDIEYQRWRQETARAKKLEPAAESIAASLKHLGSAAVFAKQKNSIEDIQFGLERNQQVAVEDQLWLPADGWVQGKEDGSVDIERFSQAISDLRKSSGISLIGFFGVDFGPNPGTGTEGILSRIASFSLQNARTPYDARRLAIVGVGTGNSSDLQVFDSGESATEKLHFPDLLRGRFVYSRNEGLRPANIPVYALPAIFQMQRDIPQPPGLSRNREITQDYGGPKLP